MKDPDARHTRKSLENCRDGYRAHMAACPETGIITGEELTRAAGEENSDDGRGDEKLLAAEDETWERSAATRPMAPGTCVRRWSEAGHTAVIKPRPVKPAVEGGFTIDDFTADEHAGTVTCPAGVTRRISRPPDRDLRRGVPRLPAARPVHGEHDRPDPDPAPPRRAAARRPPRLGHPASAA